MGIHIKAEPEQVAPWVLLPGDPDRARQVAEKHLADAERYNEVRQMWGYTGTFQGRPVSVQATGMGGPSAAIYLEELVQLGARALVRIGTCGCLDDELPLGTLLAVNAASATGSLTEQLTGVAGYAPAADFGLLRALVQAAEDTGTEDTGTEQENFLRIGPIASMDLFYDPDAARIQRLKELGVLALEMEAATVFTVAARHRIPAACLLVVSDRVSSGERIGDGALEKAVDHMVQVALTGLSLWGRST